MRLVLVFAVYFLVLECVQSKDLVVGSILNNRVLSLQNVKYNSIPLVKRVKDLFFSDPSQQIIKGIIARDLDHSDASVIITAGGVGVPYVNLRFTSGRGSALNYVVEIFA